MKRFWVPLLLVCLSVVSIVKAEIKMTPDHTGHSNPANSKSNSAYQWEIKAPAGSEMDLKEDKLLYFGTVESPVTLTSVTNSFKLTARQVVYYRGREMFFAQGEVVIDGEEPGAPSQHFVVAGEEVIYLVSRGGWVTAGWNCSESAGRYFACVENTDFLGYTLVFTENKVF